MMSAILYLGHHVIESDHTLISIEVSINSTEGQEESSVQDESMNPSGKQRGRRKGLSLRCGIKYHNRLV